MNQLPLPLQYINTLLPNNSSPRRVSMSSSFSLSNNNNNNNNNNNISNIINFDPSSHLSFIVQNHQLIILHSNNASNGKKKSLKNLLKSLSNLNYFNYLSSLNLINLNTNLLFDHLEISSNNIVKLFNYQCCSIMVNQISSFTSNNNFINDNIIQVTNLNFPFIYQALINNKTIENINMIAGLQLKINIDNCFVYIPQQNSQYLYQTNFPAYNYVINHGNCPYHYICLIRLNNLTDSFSDQELVQKGFGIILKGKMIQLFTSFNLNNQINSNKNIFLVISLNPSDIMNYEANLFMNRQLAQTNLKPNEALSSVNNNGNGNGNGNNISSPNNFAHPNINSGELKNYLALNPMNLNPNSFCENKSKHLSTTSDPKFDIYVDYLKDYYQKVGPKVTDEHSTIPHPPKNLKKASNNNHLGIFEITH
ncbi:uncharacterized protein ASCRUDRAFT_6024 [Ascoidea rubescens DSM 1968]|uniref:Uncharacterized protein n=1 Tax=Ascoidea rubescens DSM 1968 TaxID=1344418 RepID=A0A1D2VRB6_9ASCO|nr:hypothetical protein ASCRUDRAFT_6024 [Ascoidea rubescens DSM 1968]ODV64154.1 hypothetical protein ASCRUDRAFT_6024 [Ascoidea rubescens DSM 1968]